MRLLPFLAGFSLSGCAVLHHAQLSDIDNRQPRKARPITVMVSETGVDIEGATRIGQALTRNKKTQKQMQEFNDVLSLFQMGPRTGNLVFDDSYAEGVLLRLYEACPSGRLTGLYSIRESRKYPVISGEIVKVTALCLGGKS